jgi:hypothetical protein
MTSLLGFLLAACAAIAWYAASPHCMWSALRGHSRMACMAGGLLTLLSLVSWTSAVGVAAGLCATLASAMLALMVQPWLAVFIGTPDADVTATEQG